MSAGEGAGRRPSLLRRLAATLYDLLLLAAVLFVATALWLPFTEGQAIRPHDPWYGAFLLGISFAFYGWSWTHGGQTLGMRAWRLRLYSESGSEVSWRQSAIRFAGAILAWGALGIGVVWMLFSPKSLMWQDRLSATHVGWE